MSETFSFLYVYKSIDINYYNTDV